ncbi:MAG: UvrD-helicase domain-containing protein [Bacteroidales bacterium]|nr:UvrD-helicase domain-containing protein [Bacteroidales bacterium]
MIQIVKASAGSGKTYTLAREYIKLLLKSSDAAAYRHILAVTFTNKATDEMKRRILDELYRLSREPEKSPYFKYFMEEKLCSSAADLKKRCQQQLYGILHDYSAFAVSTIDRFFQQTLRAFSREIGQFSAYQVSLDREALVEESVDRVLSSLTPENKDVVDWLVGGVKENLQRSSKFRLDDSLRKIAMSLRSEDYTQAAERYGMNEDKLWTKENLRTLRTSLEKDIKAFEEQVPQAAQAVLDCLKECGVAPEDTNRGFLKALYNYHEPAPVEKPLTPAFVRNASDSSQWFSKTKESLRLQCEGILDSPLNAFLELFGQPYRIYNTARIIHKQLYSLGVAGELRKAFAEIQQEKNILSIDDSNSILKGIIDGTDTPFIYEKTGTRYDSFLLDEFQDTSDIQWDNFHPLLENSEAAGAENLIVGDVKQSIYRWRGSDWNLLGSGVQQSFPRSSVRSLKENHRTCHEIVEFNYEFFKYAAEGLDRVFGIEGPESLSSVYADVQQTAKFRDPAPGSVDIVFCDDADAEMDEIVGTIRELNCHLSDIAVLVRNNDDGSAIAARLVQENIPVVSDDSLFVKTSVTVRRAVSQLSLVDSPISAGKNKVNSFLATSMNVDIPDSYHSLTDLAEEILRDLRDANPAAFEAEIPYIQSFMDYIQDWVSLNGNNLAGFLRDWEEASPKIASPDSGEAVRIMTVHKAKGLEFPYVIFPYAEKVTLYKGSDYWCKPAVEGTPLEESAKGIFPVFLGEAAKESLFSAQYERERHLQLVDNINVFYVALTRPKYGLKIISLCPGKEEEPAKWKNFGHILYSFTGGESYMRGEPYDLGSLMREKSEETPVFPGYPSWPLNPSVEADDDTPPTERGRLRFSADAYDYFGPDGSVGAHASARRRGLVLHRILSGVIVPEDLPHAVDAAVMSGELEASDRDGTLEFLTGELDGVKQYGWFSDASARILNESAILAPGGSLSRPDRVVVRSDGSVDIVDYKFGAVQDRYQRQLGRYARLFREMGYSPVRTFIWYIREDEDDEIVKN